VDLYIDKVKSAKNVFSFKSEDYSVPLQQLYYTVQSPLFFPVDNFSISNFTFMMFFLYIF